MPGLSLWLSPPQSSPIYSALDSLIADLANDLFAPAAPRFSPHITLTSDIPVDLDPDAVIQSLPSSSPPLRIEIQKNVAYGPAYFKKIYLRIAKTPDLIQLAGECRRMLVYVPNNAGDDNDAEAKARQWQTTEYDPHLSLVYSDEWPITDDNKSHVQAKLEALFDQLGGTTSWVGGTISLVKTIGPVQDWQLLAFKDL
ncbi:2',3'-cyclic-nucleotide 3'-phosphodiesterase [Lipomyces kononenkoae]